MMRPTKIRGCVLYNHNIRGEYFCLGLEAQRIARLSQPGQFVSIKLGLDNESGPFLRRPFSIHKIRGQKNTCLPAGRENKEQIEILYEVVGEATRLLAETRAGEYLDVIGPLGKGFDLQRAKGKGQRAILVAGGMGVAPLVFLAEKLKERTESRESRTVLIGAKAKKQVLCEKEFRRLGCEVKIATDDGSRGFKGKVTDLLKYLLCTMHYALSTIYACGPRPMLKAVAELSKEYCIPAQISLEEHMACGFGVCLGCVVKTRDGYQRVCKEGPVFAADKVKWE
jgi:dihydroorotate dehydrogenase electron transfer subunit